MSRRARITLLVVLAVALFALIVGGFFWPRPQMRRGPWVTPDSLAPDSAAPGSGVPDSAPVDSVASAATAPDSTAPADTGYLRPR